MNWPAGLKRPTRDGAPRFWLENASRGGGPTLTGTEQTVQSLAARWRFSGTFLVRSNDEALSVWAFLAALDGRANTTLVPTFSGRWANWPVDQYGRQLSPSFTRRPELDGTAYQDPEIPIISQISATANATAAIGATQIAINVAQGSPLKPGQLWGVGERIYRFTRAVSAVGSVQTMEFRPRLREAVSAATAIKLSRPVCRMKQVSDAPPDFDFLTAAPITLDLVEDF